MRYFAVFFAATAATIFLLVLPAQAQDAGLQIWPAPGLYGLDQTNCDRGNKLQQFNSAKIHPEFCILFSDPEMLKVNYGQYFSAQVAQYFPNVVEKPGQDVGPSIPVNQRLGNTLIASLHMSRADIWSIDKRTGASDVFLPFTLTMNLTNAISGEVMFTETVSVIPESNFSSNNVFEPSRRELPGQLRSAIAQLVRTSSAKFKPYPVVATVRGQFGDTFLIDKGRSVGLRIGDRIGPDARVVYAEADYSIVRPVLGNFKSGDQISRQVAAPAEYLAKPAVVIIPDHMPKSMPNSYLTQIFEEVIGAQGVFSTMPVNSSFPRLRDLAASSVGMSSSVTAQRSFPDYFIHLNVYSIPQSEVNTNIAGVKFSVFVSYATANIVDRSGRIVFAATATDRIQDQIVGGVGFSAEQREDTVTKNALLKLAQRIAAEFKAQNFRLPLAEDSKGISVSDPRGALSLGSGGMVVRKAGRFTGVAGDVWAPVGSFDVFAIEGGKARLQPQDPISPKVRRDDIFVFDGGASAVQTQHSFTACLAAGSLDAVSRDLSGNAAVKSIGFTTFASGFPAPVYINDFPAVARARLSNFPGIEKYGVLKPKSEDFCIRPILRSTLLGPLQRQNGLIASKYALTIGYTVHRADQKISGSGLSVEMISGSYQPGTDPRQIELSNDRDSIAQFSLIARSALKSIEIPN